MEAAILAIGSELLGTERLDTNSLRLTACLERCGVTLVEKGVVGDDEATIATALERLAEQVEVVLVTGGLGPTADDLTRAATARAFGREIAIDERLVDELRARFAAYGREMPEVNRRQAEVIDGAEILVNRRGTAPGMRLDVGRGSLFLFPGVPRELEAMIDDHLEPWLRVRRPADAPAVERRTFKIAARAESDVEERLAPLYRRFGREPIAVLASPGEVRIVLVARGPEDDRRARLDEMAAALHEILGHAIFTDRADETLEGVVIARARAAGKTLVTAESCTGGLLAERLTRVPGSSAVFLGGVVSYANELKRDLLGVGEELLADHGAVSEPVAVAMARGARTRLGGDLAVAITGIAGPGGGSDEKPVGTVHVVLAGDGVGRDDDAARGDGAARYGVSGGTGVGSGTIDDDVLHRRVRLPGGRARVRQLTAQLALELLRRHLSVERNPAGRPAGDGADTDDRPGAEAARG